MRQRKVVLGEQLVLTTEREYFIVLNITSAKITRNDYINQKACPRDAI